MNYNEVLKNAKVNLNGSCRVCPVCNGKACAGEVPGMGGKGTGEAFTANVESLKKYKLNMRVLHNANNPDTSIELFGRKIKLPIFAAPVTGTTLNMGGKFTEQEYISWVIKGCLAAGIYPMVGDTAVDSFLLTNLEELKKADGNGIAIIKPWKNPEVIKKIKKAEETGVFAVGMDIDAAGLITLALHGKPVGPKTLEDIKEFVDEGAADMIQIKTPDLGGINNTIEAVLYCKEHKIGAYQGGTCNETDRSAQICTDIALATRPCQILAKPGMGVDEGLMIVYNEMNRVLALLKSKKEVF